MNYYTHKLLNNGYNIALKTLANYMKELGIKAVYYKKKPKPIKNTKINANYKNILNRKYDVEEVNKVWCIDITFIQSLKGFVYLTSIMDVYSRRIIAWKVLNKK